MPALQGCLWNPLDWIVDDEVIDDLDLQEVQDLAEDVKRIALKEGVPLGKTDSTVVGREVGDDRVDLSRSAEALCAAQSAQSRIVKMVTSEEDTGIRRDLLNFCEVSTLIPTDPFCSFDHARKRGDFSWLGYNDSIILRLILDVQKGGGDDHSSTPTGKMSMLGSRLATPRREIRGLWMIASLFQDAYLTTHKADEPKYLPQQMGGTGVTALFDNPNNIYLYTLAYKGGTYARIYGTAVHELARSLEYLERGLQVAPILCSRLREKQDYFHGTYDNLVFVPRPLSLGLGDDPPVPLYTATGGANRYQNFENRLIRTRHVVTRRQAVMEWEHTRRLHGIFLNIWSSIGEMEDQVKARNLTKRANYDNAIRANSAMQNLLNREANPSDVKRLMGDAAYQWITTGRRTFERTDAAWVYSNGRGEHYSLDDIHTSEDIYSREEVSVEETFKVARIPLRPITSDGVTLQTTKTRVGLYQINTTMYEWADILHNRLKGRRDELNRPLKPEEAHAIFEIDPEWVNDDNGLIGRCRREHADSAGRVYSVLLVTSDKRLCNQMAESCNVSVIRVNPLDFISRAVREGLNPQDGLSLQQVLPWFTIVGHHPDQIYYDTGSLAAQGATLERAEHDSRSLVKRELIETGRFADHKRFSRVRLTDLGTRPSLRISVHKPVARPRPWRQGSRPVSSVYSSHDSWRRSDSSQRSGSAEFTPDTG